MKYCMIVFLSLVAVAVPSSARENPFAPVNTKESIGKATQIEDKRKNFSQVKTQLPSTARILKKLELHYQNLDGSIESQVVPIDKKIDWHNELVLQKTGEDTNMQQPPQSAKKTAVPHAKVPKEEKSPSVNKSFEGVLDFEVQDDTITVRTQDRKIRDFLVTDPYKIVLDFEREIDFFTKTYELKNQKVESVTFGKHAGYYRMVLALDGQYRYKLETTQEGFVIELY